MNETFARCDAAEVLIHHPERRGETYANRESRLKNAVGDSLSLG